MTTQELLDKRVLEINNALSYIDQAIAKRAALLAELSDLQKSKVEVTDLVAAKVELDALKETPIEEIKPL